MYNYPYIKPGLFGKSLGLAKAFNWGGLLEGTQKTLGVINQAIPVFYQIKPMISNARTMFRIADELKSPSTKNTSTTTNTKSVVTSQSEPINKPIFYM